MPSAVAQTPALATISGHGIDEPAQPVGPLDRRQLATACLTAAQGRAAEVRLGQVTSLKAHILQLRLHEVGLRQTAVLERHALQAA